MLYPLSYGRLLRNVSYPFFPAVCIGIFPCKIRDDHLINGREHKMPNLLNEQEFTERFTEAISPYKLSPSCKETLVLELHYGADEPVLTISLKEAFARYQANPDELADVLHPYVLDIGWTAQPPRYPSKEVYEHSLPTLRNFYLHPPTADELGEVETALKGPIVFDDVLKTPSEHIVVQFHLFGHDTYTPLRKGDILPCIPDAGLLAGLALHNLALATEAAGITATPLRFESLKARSYLIGLGDARYSPSIAALSNIPQVMASLEETLRAHQGLIAIMPSRDQLIVSVDTDNEYICELGVLAKQMVRHASAPLSSLIWTFSEGKMEAVQSLELEEIESPSENN